MVISKFCCLLMLILVASTIGQFSKNQQEQAVVVIHIPRKANYSKSDLNKDLSKAKNFKQAEAIVKANTFLRDVQVVLSVKNKDGENVWHTINAASGKTAAVNWITLRSKDNLNGRFQSLNDIRTILSDTVLVLDSLKLDFYLQGQRYNNKGFFIFYNCLEASGPKKLSLNHPGFAPYELKLSSFICNSSLIACRLYNDTDPNRELTRFLVRFSDGELRDELTSMVTYIKRTEPTFDSGQITLILQPYLRRVYGKITYSYLQDWIKQKMLTGKEFDE